MSAQPDTTISTRIEACILAHGPIDPTQLQKKLGLPVQQKIFSHLAGLVRQKRIINLYSGMDHTPRYVAATSEHIERINSIAPARRPDYSSIYVEKNWRTTPIRAGALDHEKHGSLQPRIKEAA